MEEYSYRENQSFIRVGYIRSPSLQLRAASGIYHLRSQNADKIANRVGPSTWFWFIVGILCTDRLMELRELWKEGGYIERRGKFKPPNIFLKLFFLFWTRKFIIFYKFAENKVYKIS